MHKLTWWQEVWESTREQRQETTGTGGKQEVGGPQQREGMERGPAAGQWEELAVTEKRNPWWVDPTLKIASWRGRQGWAPSACDTVHHDISTISLKCHEMRKIELIRTPVRENPVWEWGTIYCGIFVLINGGRGCVLVWNRGWTAWDRRGEEPECHQSL